MPVETCEKLREVLMATDDFFRARLDQMIDLRHPLVVLAGRMPWGQIEAALAPAFARKNRAGKVMPGSEMPCMPCCALRVTTCDGCCGLWFAWA